MLLFVSILPIMHKIVFWSEYFKFEKLAHLHGKTQPKVHFFDFILFPLFALSFLVFFDENLEIFIFNFIFYTLLLYNVFVVGQILRGRMLKHILSLKNILTFFLICFFAYSAIYAYRDYIYIISLWFIVMSGIWMYAISYLWKIILKK